jgi:ubiquinone/menaquinone biosynthesis C-methylase UbiE
VWIGDYSFSRAPLYFVSSKDDYNSYHMVYDIKKKFQVFENFKSMIKKNHWERLETSC